MERILYGKLFGKKLVSLILVGAMLLGLTACGQGAVNQGQGSSETASETAFETASEATTEAGKSTFIAQAVDLMEGITAQDVTEKALDETFATAMTDFGVMLFQNRLLADGESEGENVLISPLSVMLALAMTANGAKGETRAEMEKFLGGELTIEELNRYLYTNVKKLPAGDSYKLDIANSIWIRDVESLTVYEDFLQTNADYYQAAVRKEPFDEGTKDEINGWVKENTDGLIDSIVEEIPAETMMYLLNALVFDAKWAREYYQEDIREGSFTAADGKLRKVSMMSSEETVYLDDREAVGFIKYYTDNAYSFVALLPDENVEIEDYIASMTGERIRSLIENGRRATVIARTPKFSYEDETLMNEELKALGMPLAFSGECADFSGMGRTEGGNLYIGNVVHKTFISVDELGTKAGAVTAVSVDECEAVSPDNIYYVTLDRPFVYMILDNAAGVPVFIGAVMDIGE